MAPTTITHSPFPLFNSPFLYPLKSTTKLLFPVISPKHKQRSISISSSLNPGQSILDTISGDQKLLPSVRTFENDLCRLSLVGSVDFQQALTAAAADGGEAADEHLVSATEAMVVETVFPGNECGTISTRLFLPATKVKEKAIKLRRSLTKDMLNGTKSKDILAMTFKQVVLQQLWNFELSLFRPGTGRNMDDLQNPREVSVMLSLSSSDERVIAGIAEVVCIAVLGNSENTFFRDSVKTVRNKFFRTRELISSKDSSVVILNFLGHEVLANSKVLLEKYKMEKGNYKANKLQKSKGNWWTSTALAKLEKIGGPEFCAWVSEFIPSYMLVIDESKLNNVKFDGWKKSEANKWEVVLTHSQMARLADILDMYYEDVFTLPDKRLSCYPVANSPKLALNKGSSFLKILSVVIVTGVFLVTISVLRKVYLPHLPSRRFSDSQPISSEVNHDPLHSVDNSQVRESCFSIIKRVKDSLGWPGEIGVEADGRAWIGPLPPSLRIVEDVESNSLDSSLTSLLPQTSEEETKALQDIASYQVVLSSNGDIVGLQPTNRVAVNNWARNPLAKVLYGGKTLSPGVLEPGLKINFPSSVIVLELLMSVNPDSLFALARRVDFVGEK